VHFDRDESCAKPYITTNEADFLAGISTGAGRKRNVNIPSAFMSQANAQTESCCIALRQKN
jgi:hypothetical protein